MRLNSSLLIHYYDPNFTAFFYAQFSSNSSEDRIFAEPLVLRCLFLLPPISGRHLLICTCIGSGPPNVTIPMGWLERFPGQTGRCAGPPDYPLQLRGHPIHSILGQIPPFKHHSKALDEFHLYVKFSIFAAKIRQITPNFQKISSHPGLPPDILEFVGRNAGQDY